MAKRILIYTNHFYPENFKVNDIAQLLSEEDYEVNVVTGIPNYPSGEIFPGYGYFKKTEEHIGKVRVKRLPLIPRGKGSKFRLVLNYLSYFFSCIVYTLYLGIFKKKYDVVFVHHTSPVLIAIPPILYRWIRWPKMILWDLDMWPDTLKALGIIKNKSFIGFLEMVVTFIYRNYDHILVGSESFVAKGRMRVGAARVEYFPNWAEEIFVKGKMERPESDPKFPNDGFNLMYAGNIGEAQDFKRVLRAMKSLKKEEINWLIVGDGRKRKGLEKRTVDAGISKKVIFYGNNKLVTMPYFFSQADLMFFSLMNQEIFAKTVPAKLQAYMAFGKPVIGMISGEGSKIIEEANCGFTCRSGDFREFAKLIRKAQALSKEELEQMGRNGKQYYIEHFSIERRKEQLLRLIETS